MSQWIIANTASIVIWVGALCTLGLYTILYKENKIYRLFEHIYLGLAMGFLIAQTWTKVLLPKWWVPMWDKGEWWLIFALFAGLFYYFIFIPKFNWLARMMIGFFLGVTAGRAFQVFANDTWPQIVSSFRPIFPKLSGTALSPAQVQAEIITSINNLIFLIILITVMTYFFFSIEQKNPALKRSARIGRYMLMFTFGAIFGSTMMARLSLLIDRMDMIMNTFGNEIGGPGVAFGILMALAALVLFLTYRDSKREKESGGN